MVCHLASSISTSGPNCRRPPSRSRCSRCTAESVDVRAVQISPAEATCMFGRLHRKNSWKGAKRDQRSRVCSDLAMHISTWGVSTLVPENLMEATGSLSSVAADRSLYTCERVDEGSSRNVTSKLDKRGALPMTRD